MAIRKISAKQRKHLIWIEEVARPYLIEKFGDICQCCKEVHYPHDVDHILSKGSRPDLKEDLDNLQLLGRFPCHRLKTDHIECTHA